VGGMCQLAGTRFVQRGRSLETLSEGLSSLLHFPVSWCPGAVPGQKIRDRGVRLVFTGIQHVWGMCVSSYPMINSFLDVDS